MKSLFSVIVAVFFLSAGCGPKAEDAASPVAPAQEAAPAIATGASAAAPAPAVAATTFDWTIDKSKSRLEFIGTQTGKEFKGAFAAFVATIVFDPANLAASRIEVVVDTASAKTGDRQRDDALPGNDWFAAKAFPRATFTSDEIISAGEGVYEARGKLTIRDAARDAVLPFTLSINGDRAVAEGATTLVRTDFGVGQGDFATGQWVGLEVKVAFHVEASR